MPPANNEQLKCRLKHNIFLLRPPKTDVPPLGNPHPLNPQPPMDNCNCNKDTCKQFRLSSTLFLPSFNYTKQKLCPHFAYTSHFPIFPFSTNLQPSTISEPPPPLHPSASKFEVSNGKRFLANHNPQSTWKLLSHQLLFRFKGNSSKRFWRSS